MRDRPSRTAIKVAKGIVHVGHDVRRAALLPDGAAEETERLLVRAGYLSRLELAFYTAAWSQRMVLGMERYTIPGASTWLALRKRIIDDRTLEAIGEGATQVLVVGGGFDTLCIRRARRYPAVTFVEIDHPATQAAKLRGTDGSAPNLRLIAADLAKTSLADALAGVWRADELSVIIVEGVLMYLRPRDVGSLLHAVRGLVPSGSLLLATYVLRDRTGRIDFGRPAGLAQWSLQLMGEPVLWAARDAADVDALLATHGFAREPGSIREHLRSRYLAPAGMADAPIGNIEHLAVARAC